MFENFVFPDGTSMQWESVSWLQKKFMNWFNEERRKKVLTFPVETVNLLDNGKGYMDKEWADFAAEMYSKGHSFFTYRSDSVDSLASCCFSGNEYFLSKSGPARFKNYQDGDKVWVYTPDSGLATATVHTYGKQILNQVTFIREEQEEVIEVTPNHIWKLEDGSYTNNLKIGDRLTPIVFNHDSVHEEELFYHPIFDRVWTVKDIKENVREDLVYCLEVDTDSKMFYLNHWIPTHNCRLRNEVQENTFSYTLGAGGISTGSKGVITLNINRMVQNLYRENPNATLKDISEMIREQVKKVHKYLIAYNNFLYELYDAKLLPVYNAGYISLEKQYLSLGINGLLESAEFLGIDISPNDKYLQYVDCILRPIYEENKNAKTDKIMFNTEYVPKMCGHKVA